MSMKKDGTKKASVKKDVRPKDEKGRFVKKEKIEPGVKPESVSPQTAKEVTVQDKKFPGKLLTEGVFKEKFDAANKVGSSINGFEPVTPEATATPVAEPAIPEPAIPDPSHEPVVDADIKEPAKHSPIDRLKNLYHKIPMWVYEVGLALGILFTGIILWNNYTKHKKQQKAAILKAKEMELVKQLVEISKAISDKDTQIYVSREVADALKNDRVAYENLMKSERLVNVTQNEEIRAKIDSAHSLDAMRALVDTILSIKN